MPLAASQVLQCRDNYTDHFCCPDTAIGQVCLSVCPDNSFKANNHYFSVLMKLVISQFLIARKYPIS